MILQKFKTLLAHTLGTLTYTLPTTAFVALAAPNLNGGPFVGMAVLVGVTQLTLLAYKGDGGTQLDSTYAKPLNAHFWKSVLDMPEIHLVQKLQKRVLIKLRRGQIDQEVLGTYKNYKMNSEAIKEWVGMVIKHKASREGNGDLFISEWKARDILNFKFKEIVSKVEELVPHNQLTAFMSSTGETMSLNLTNFDVDKCKFLMKHGYCKELTAKDYKDFKVLVQKDDFSSVFSFLKNYESHVNWVQIKNIVVENFTGSESRAGEILKEIDAIAPGEKLITIINANNTKVEYCNVLQQPQSLIKDLKAQYDFIYSQQAHLSAGTLQELNQHLSGTLPILLATNTATLSPESSQQAKNLIEGNLQILTDKMQRLRVEIEASILKELTIQQKYGEETSVKHLKANR